MESSSGRRILIVDNSIGVTGARKSIETVVEALSNKFDFFLASSDSREESFFKQTFFFDFLEVKKNLKILFYIPKLLSNTTKLFKIIKKHNINIVHVNDIYNLTGVLAKIIYPKFKLIHHVRLLPSSYIGPLYHLYARIVLKYADKIICVSDAVSDALPPSPKKVMIYNTISTEEKLPSKVIKEKSIIKLVCLGNLIPGKGQNLVIDAFSIAYKIKKEGLLLEFVGGIKDGKKNDDYKFGLLKQIELYGLEKFIVFTPFTQDIEKVIKNADIVINLSESESFSRVALEALSFGTPLISSDSGGTKELFEHGRSGILVPNRDINAAAKAIISLMDNIEMRKYFSKEGQKYVREKFNLSKITERMEEVYSST